MKESESCPLPVCSKQLESNDRRRMSVASQLPQNSSSSDDEDVSSSDLDEAQPRTPRAYPSQDETSRTTPMVQPSSSVPPAPSPAAPAAPVVPASPAASQAVATTPKNTAGRRRKRRRTKGFHTGYTEFSSTKRREIIEQSQNTTNTFRGEIEKQIGEEWRNMSGEDKQAWEERAKEYNKTIPSVDTQVTSERSGSSSSGGSSMPSKQEIEAMLQLNIVLLSKIKDAR